MKHYKEIDLLNDLIEKQQLRLVSISELYEGISLIPVQFQFQNKVFEVLIDDEYNDLSIKNNTLWFKIRKHHIIIMKSTV